MGKIFSAFLSFSGDNVGPESSFRKGYLKLRVHHQGLDSFGAGQKAEDVPSQHKNIKITLSVPDDARFRLVLSRSLKELLKPLVGCFGCLELCLYSIGELTSSPSSGPARYPPAGSTFRSLKVLRKERLYNENP